MLYKVRFHVFIWNALIKFLDEEIRRLREELASEGAYNQVSFQYESSAEGDAEGRDHEVQNDFQVPGGLILPVGLNMVSCSVCVMLM